MLTIRLVFVCFLLMSIYGSFAQDYFLKVPNEPIRKIEVQDSAELSIKIQSWKMNQWKSGYPFANLDSISSDTLFLYLGSRESIDLDSIYYENGTASPTNIRKPWKGIEQQLRYWTSHGYPYTTLNLMEVIGTQNIFIDRGPSITYDSIRYNKGIISRQLLEQTLDMEYGKPYSEENFQQLTKKMERFASVELAKAPSIYFENNLATIQLELKETQTNSFEGVIGLLPRQSVTDDILVTGFLDIQLVNLFQSAKSLDMTWNRFGDQSQSLEIDYFHPFIAGTPLLFRFDFGLLKQDTTFLNQTLQLGIGTYLGKGKLFFEYSRRTGTIIETSIQNLRETLVYPSKISAYAITYQLASVNRPFAFGDKFDFKAGFAFGLKSVDIDNANQLLVEEPNTVLFKLDFKIRNQISMTKRLKLFNALTFGSFQTNQVFENERYRIGGLYSLRGFNENVFFVDSYMLNRSEIRQYFQSRSYFYVFQDVMFAISDQDRLLPFGFGLGFSLQTKTGLLNFALAQGKEQSKPINLSESKVHIGFISKF
ncbi:MAG: ShlB/FhaC/HecB family hemolysin secretion/activation protein [Cyclobacteriaceae bacterium]